MSDANIIKINYQSFPDKEMSDFEITETLNITEKSSAVFENVFFYQILANITTKKKNYIHLCF